MPLPAQFSLSLELASLARVLPVRSTVNSIISLARDLKRSGSDLLVEEDLVAIFGRGKIVASIENQFRHAVSIASITPFYRGSEIVLDSGPGATIGRALREGRDYMASVIQLSFLGSMHEEASFASALTECMQKRSELNVANATPCPDYDGILGAIQACNSQTSRFPWGNLTSLVESKFPQSSQWFRCPHSPLRYLSRELLLGTMDYLYLTQSLPDDRIVMVQNQMGLVPIVVWAHYILGLEVLIKGSPDGDIQFGTYALKRPQVVITWSGHWETIPPEFEGEWGTMSLPCPTISLLDGQMEIVLTTTEPKDGEFMTIEGQERFRLQGYGTAYLRRMHCFNTDTLLADDDPIYTDCVQTVVALAILVQKFLYRKPHGPILNEDIPKECFFKPDNVRVTTSAELLFTGIKFDKKEINRYVERLMGFDWDDMPLPPSVRAYIEKGSAGRGVMPNLCGELSDLATIVLTFAQVVELEACADIPLLYTGLMPISASSIPRKAKQVISLAPNTWNRIIFEMLRGVQPECLVPQEFEDFPVLVSHRGWSLFPNFVGDIDPGMINPELLSIKRGVPTNVRTNERKFLILDAPPVPLKGNGRHPVIIDRGPSYLPRCVTPVTKRTEMYSSRSKEFWLSIRFDVDESSSPLRSGEQAKFPLYASYRQFHGALCGVIKTARCSHADEDPQPLQLDLGVVTAKGFQWVSGDVGDDTRICILLVRNDSRARWLAVCNLIYRKWGIDVYYDETYRLERRVVLRCPGCCDDCAVKFASSMPGKWLVIL